MGAFCCQAAGYPLGDQMQMHREGQKLSTYFRNDPRYTNDRSGGRGAGGGRGGYGPSRRYSDSDDDYDRYRGGGYRGRPSYSPPRGGRGRARGGRYSDSDSDSDYDRRRGGSPPRGGRGGGGYARGRRYSSSDDDDYYRRGRGGRGGGRGGSPPRGGRGGSPPRGGGRGGSPPRGGRGGSPPTRRPDDRGRGAPTVGDGRGGPEDNRGRGAAPPVGDGRGGRGGPPPYGEDRSRADPYGRAKVDGPPVGSGPNDAPYGGRGGGSGRGYGSSSDFGGRGYGGRGDNGPSGAAPGDAAAKGDPYGSSSGGIGVVPYAVPGLSTAGSYAPPSGSARTGYNDASGGKAATSADSERRGNGRMPDTRGDGRTGYLAPPDSRAGSGRAGYGSMKRGAGSRSYDDDDDDDDYDRRSTRSARSRSRSAYDSDSDEDDEDDRRYGRRSSRDDSKEMASRARRMTSPDLPHDKKPQRNSSWSPLSIRAEESGRSPRKNSSGRSPDNRSFAKRFSAAFSGGSDKSPKKSYRRRGYDDDDDDDSDSETDSAYLSDEESDDDDDYSDSDDEDEEYRQTRRWVMGKQRHIYNDQDEDIDDMFYKKKKGKDKEKEKEKAKAKEKEKGKEKDKKEKEKKESRWGIRRRSTREGKVLDGKTFAEVHEGVKAEWTELEKKKWEDKEKDTQETQKKEDEEAERKRKAEEEAELERKRQEEEAKKQEILKYYSQKPEKHIVTVQAYIRRHLAKKRVRFYKQESLRREKICTEMRDSEHSYMTVLTYLVEDFYEPLMKIASEGGADPMVTTEQVQTMFSNSVAILEIHRTLAEQLTEVMRQWYPQYNMAKLYIDLADKLYIYSEYINGYDKAMQTLQNLQLSKNAFKEFIEKQEKVREKKQDIFSLLISPVQRIPRYELLLRDLSKHTWPEHAGYEDLVAALKKIMVVNTFINNEKRKIDNKVRMYEIHAGLKGVRNMKVKKYLIQEHRRFLREGMLEKRKKGYISSVRQTEKWLFLFNDIILVSLMKKRRSRNAKKPYQAHNTKCIELEGATVTPQKDGVSFIIDSPLSGGKTLWIAKSEKDKDDWIAAIQASIDETKELLKKGVVIQREDPRQSSYSISSFLGFGGDEATEKDKDKDKKDKEG